MLRPSRRAWVTAAQLGEGCLAVDSRLQRSVQTYWEEQERNKQEIPEQVSEALAAQRERIQRCKQAQWAQTVLPRRTPHGTGTASTETKTTTQSGYVHIADAHWSSL